MMLNRRQFAMAGALGTFAWPRAVASDEEIPGPVDWVGRVFVQTTTDAVVDSLSVTVWQYPSQEAASAARSLLVEQETAADGADDVSIVEFEEFPLSSLPGSLLSWTEVVGDGAVEMLFAAGYFQQGVFVWALVAEGDDRDAMFSLITEVGHDLLSRGVPATPEVEHPFVGGLWDLLPMAQDLPGAFELYQMMERGNVYTPEGTPIPAFQERWPRGNQRARGGVPPAGKWKESRR
jgi:hypothetical protein